MNKRFQHRQEPRFPVTLQVKILASEVEVNGTTKDVSNSGICLTCGSYLAPGLSMHLELNLALGNYIFSETLVVLGRVIWCTPLENIFQIGATFVGISKEKQHNWEMFLCFLKQEVLLTSSEVQPSDELFDTSDDDSF